MRMHGRCGWLYLGESAPVALRGWMYDLSNGTLETTPLYPAPAQVQRDGPVSFRLYPAATIPEVPPDPGDQHFWGFLSPGGAVFSVRRHPADPNPRVASGHWRPGTPAEPRELVGRLVRQVWVQWAREQPDPKPSWLLAWEERDDGQREVDMRIGAALFDAGYRAGTDREAQGA
jgi:hypothetical protein